VRNSHFTAPTMVDLALICMDQRTGGGVTVREDIPTGLEGETVKRSVARAGLVLLASIVIRPSNSVKTITPVGPPMTSIEGLSQVCSYPSLAASYSSKKRCSQRRDAPPGPSARGWSFIVSAKLGVFMFSPRLIVGMSPPQAGLTARKVPKATCSFDVRSIVRARWKRLTICRSCTA
jgi:hypothetical protein